MSVSRAGWAECFFPTILFSYSSSLPLRTLVAEFGADAVDTQNHWGALVLEAPALDRQLNVKNHSVKSCALHVIVRCEHLFSSWPRKQSQVSYIHTPGCYHPCAA
jgi:hypothetical protein